MLEKLNAITSDSEDFGRVSDDVAEFAGALSYAVTWDDGNVELVNILTANLNASAFAAVLASPSLLDEDGKANRQMALSIADYMTKEEGQNLYHFVVLLTKLIR